MQYQVLNNWRTSQSAANPSLVLNSLLAGNLQGILRKSGRLARICPSEHSKISLLEDNSLETGTGNLIAQNREFIETSREFAASCRELSAGRGKFPGRATTVEEWASASIADGVFQVAVAANPGWETRRKNMSGSQFRERELCLRHSH